MMFGVYGNVCFEGLPPGEMGIGSAIEGGFRVEKI